MDERFLREMLYQAIYVPPGSSPPPRDIVHQPELSRYVDDWGKEGDLGYIAEANGRPVGACWLRRLTGTARGYGYVNDETPELSMAVRLGYRGQGVGSCLLAELLREAAHHYQAISLSVAADNPARRLYERHGFTILTLDGGMATMIRYFSEA
jgi:ribosomal protein S18 acetylase RimI-like enzyme